jgi:hypothetical protein
MGFFIQCVDVITLTKIGNPKFPKKTNQESVRFRIGGFSIKWATESYEHYAQGGRGGCPVTPGYGYSTIAKNYKLEKSHRQSFMAAKIGV